MIRYRRARPDGIATCVQFIADHRFLGPRYGTAIEHLGTVWRGFLGSDALFSFVAEEIGSGTVRLIGAHIGCFISDEFANWLATRPLKWIGPELVNRALHGPPPLLTDEQVRHANSNDGLNVMVWPTAPCPDFKNLPELLQGSQPLFFETFRGYSIKRLQTQATDPAEMVIAVNSGARYLQDAASGHFESLQEPIDSVFLHPHLLEVTRQMAAQRPGAWASFLFARRSPTIGFTRSEQKLLSAALHGGTDGELSDQLGISLSAVKKTWAAIYLRVQSRKPSDLRIEIDATDGDRGKEKKQKLLAYLREHPEELRPYSLRLLENGL